MYQKIYAQAQLSSTVEKPIKYEYCTLSAIFKCVQASSRINPNTTKL